MNARLPLSARLRAATATLHREVEATPLIADLIGGRLAIADYGRLLRNLQPVYAALERRLDEAAALPAALTGAPLRRLAALEADLAVVAGPDWAALPVLPAAQAYAAHLAALDEPRLAAHAYVRYLGDLAGGQMLARRVARLLGREDGLGTAFHRFGAPGAAALASAFRAALDGLAGDAATEQMIVDEACDGFRRHAALFAGLYGLRG